MPGFELTINVIWFVAICLTALAAGFLLRSAHVSSFKKKISELENEMLRNHAEILDLQKQKAELERTLNSSDIPVISLKPSKDEKPAQPIKKHS